MEAANPSQALARVLVDELARGGVAHAALAPGSRSTALAMALDEDPRIACHVLLDERSAGFLALGAARASGRPAVVATTSGTATTNLTPAVVEADAARIPLIVLTADRPPELRHTGANQTIDQVKLYGGFVRWFCEVGAPEDRPDAVAYWRATVSRAVAEALGVAGPPGPVHCNLAFREPTVPATDDGRAPPAPWTRSLDGRRDRRSWTAIDRAPRIIPPAELQAFAGRCLSTERGVVVVGESDARGGPIHDFAAAAGWPVIAEPLSDARYGRAVTTAHHLLGHAPFASRHRPDLAVRIGRAGLSPRLASWLGPEVPQVLVDRDGGWLDPGRTAGELVVADPELWCAQLAELLAVDAGGDWLASWTDADARARAALDGALDALDVPTEPRTARDVVAATPGDSLLVVGSSMPVRDVDRYAGPRRLRMLGNRGASGIDGFVSTTLGAALAHGSAVALTGDLSLLHDANGFLLDAATERLDATIVVVNNDGGGIFSFLPQARYPGVFERLFATPHGRDLATLAAFHGLAHELIDQPEALAERVRRPAPGLRLLEVRTDRRDNADLHDALEHEVRAALGAG